MSIVIPPVLLTAKGKDFRPLKAPNSTPETPEEIARLKWPMYFSPKIDGIRGTNFGRMTSAQNIAFPSHFVHKYYGIQHFLGVDGELGAGPANSPTLFSDTFSAVMTHGSMTPVNWYVFDLCDPARAHWPYEKRMEELRKIVLIWDREIGPNHRAELNCLWNITIVWQTLVNSWEQALEEEQRVLKLGYEGGMLRSPTAEYKYGRSTLNQNILIKLKRFETCEARIVGFFEKEHNYNEATTGEMGQTKRSTHKEGKVLAGTLGGFEVVDLKTGVQFRLGSGIGMDDNFRAHVWAHREQFLNQICSYKKLKMGEKDKPRNCTFRGLRSPIDL